MVESSNEIFIRNLKMLRKRKFPKQEDFAPLVGFESVRGYQKYEQGESAPTTEILDRFSAILDCSPLDLIDPDFAENSPSGIVLKRVASLFSTADLVTLHACLYLWRGSNEDLAKVHRAIRDEVALLRKHIDLIRSANE